MLAMALSAASIGQAQVSNPTNNAGVLDYVGCDNTSPFPLRIMQNDNQPIEWYTNSLRRMRLTQALTSQTVNGYTGLTLTGHLGVGGFNSLPGNPPPLTLLHLDNGGTEVAGYRPWMRTGTSMTEASEWMYVGFKREATDRLDAVINWADNREGFGGGQIGPDALRMVFTSPRTTTSVSGSVNGLEIARLIPAVSGNEGYFGIGDYFTAGLQPTERLDVLNGKVRIRQLPADTVSTSNEYVTVNTTTGVLEHRPLPPSTTTGCDWMIGSGMVSTATAAVGTNGACPDAGWKVLMGPGSAGNYKLAVRVDQPNCPGCGVTGGTNVEMTTKVGNSVIGSRVAVAQGSADSTLEIRGLKIETLNASKYNYGLDADVQSSVGTPHRVYGAWLRASTLAGGNALQIAGFRASGAAGAGTTVGTTVGIWGKAGGGSTNYSVFGENAGTTASDWAGYFSGRTYSPGGVWTASDNNLKTEVESLTNATEKILTLRPKTYLFNTESYPQMGLPEGLQFGFLASDLQEQFPEMVIETTQPAEEDHTGQAVQPAVHFRAVNTSGILPLVVGALQEEHIARVADAAEQHLRLESLEARVNEQSARLADLEHQLAACCANPDGVRSLPQGSNEPAGLGNDLAGTDKLHIQPNPFNERTTVYYTLDRGGRTQLLANSSDGRELRVLQEANLEAGSYQFEWDTASLAPGLYYVTLLVDGEPVVKKAVKVDR